MLSLFLRINPNLDNPQLCAEVHIRLIIASLNLIARQLRPKY
ncbi:DUF4058 family protein [Nostoc sp. PA-18-2419]|nr:DUF4058 family protein [Nostoc sp. PA-18-2419]